MPRLRTIRTTRAVTEPTREGRRALYESIASALLHFDAMGIVLTGLRVDADGRVEYSLDGDTDKLTPEQREHLGME